MNDFASYMDLDKIFGGKPSHDKFLQSYELTINSWKKTSEYLTVLDDIKFLIDIDAQELRKKIKHVLENDGLFDYNKENNKAEKDNQVSWFEKLINELYDKIKDLSPDSLSIGLKNLDLLNLMIKILIFNYEDKFQKTILQDKNIALVKFSQIIQMELNFEKLVNAEDFENIPIELIFNIQNMSNSNTLFNICETMNNEELQKLSHSIISSRGHDVRYEKKRDTYEYAIDDTEYLWGEEKSQLNINQMVEELLSMKKYKMLSGKTLRTKIHSTAQKYDKIPPRGRPRK
jgi:hypothetical protein